MFRKRSLYITSIFVLILFFFFTFYLITSINYYTDAKEKVRLSATEYSIESIEHEIRLKSLNLPEEYKRKVTNNDVIIKQFQRNVRSKTRARNLSELWAEFDSQIGKDQIFNSNSTNIGHLIHALKTAKILSADTYSKGTQFKLIFKLEGDHLAVFKPQWYNIERVIVGQVYAGKDRYGSEILAFYLAAILNLRLTPVAAERVVNVKRELLPVASSTLNSTVFERNNKICIYGKCFYCKKEDPICADDEGKIRGAILFHVPGKFQVHNSPWQRTYKSGKKALWEIDAKYCSKVKSKILNRRLLDLVDVSIFDFLIQNGDRHHYETLNDKVVLIDNGKGLGNPYVHHVDILAPLYQCCVLRSSTWERLKLFAAGSLSEILLSFPEISSVVSLPHLRAIDERINLIYATVDMCRKRNKLF